MTTTSVAKRESEPETEAMQPTREVVVGERVVLVEHHSPLEESAGVLESLFLVAAHANGIEIVGVSGGGFSSGGVACVRLRESEPSMEALHGCIQSWTEAGLRATTSSILVDLRRGPSAHRYRHGGWYTVPNWYSA